MKTKRELGFFQALIMGLSGAIGFEIFRLLDYPYFDLVLSGASMLFVLLLAGLANLLIMLNYCELSTAIPEPGGDYTFIKKAYGVFVPFILGCFRWLASIFGAALAAVVFAEQLSYLLALFPILQSFGSNQTLPAFIKVTVVVAMTVLEIKGLKKVGVTIVFAFIAIFAIFIGGGLLPGVTLVEVIPRILPEDISKIPAAVVYVFPMFFGVRSLIAGAAQIKNPEKNLPKAILLSSLLIIPLYLCIAYTAVRLVPPLQNKPNVEQHLLNLAAEKIFGQAGGALLALAGMVASLSALGTSLTVQSSILRGMSRDKYLPKSLLSVHQHFRTHHLAILTGAVFIMFLSLIDVNLLVYAASFGSLLVFALVNLSLIKLRKEKPYMERPFKTPLYPFTPISGIVLSLLLLVSPALVGRVSPEFTLTSSIGLTALVLTTYYIRMIGHHRMQIAVGGVNIGVGIILLLLTWLKATETMFDLIPSIPWHILLFFSIISLIAGILNTMSHT